MDSVGLTVVEELVPLTDANWLLMTCVGRHIHDKKEDWEPFHNTLDKKIESIFEWDVIYS